MPKPRVKFSSFFDSKKVIAATSRAERKVLSGFGSFVRTTARQSMTKPSRVKLNELPKEQADKIRARKRQGKPVYMPFKASRPGQPPKYITRALKDRLFFGFDLRSRSVVVGPEKFRAKAKGVPRILEEGGTTTRTAGANKGKRVTVKPRPFMKPALDENLPELPALWRDAIKG